MNKKILYVIPKLGLGGAERVAVNLINESINLGNNVEVLLFKEEGALINELSNKTKISILDIEMNHFWLFKISTYIKITNFIKNNKYDSILSCIRTSNIPLGISLNFINIKKMKIVFREANTFDEILLMSSFKSKIFLLLMKIAYTQCHAIIANSIDTKKDLLKYNIVEDKYIKVIGNPVVPQNIKALLTASINEPLFHTQGLKIVIAIGRLNIQKGFDFLIDSFRSVIDTDDTFRLVIIGEGPERVKLSNLIKLYKLDNFIFLIGKRKNIYPYLYNSDIFVLSSRWEGFGNVLVEALSAGLQIVSTSCPGGPEMILENGKYGEIVKSDNIEDFSKSIVKIGNKKPFNKENQMYRANDFSITNITKEYLKTILSDIRD
jgi:glycosyltransferase involved in cell wall biosynthesis